jgi:hypothetical protein
MIVKHDKIDTPHGNTIIWRYMGLDKFLDLITSSRLYFTNAAKMTDKYEGIIPRKNIDKKRRHLANYYSTDPTDIETELSIYKHQYDDLRNLTLINCWSIRQHESYALWKIYLGGSKSGIAIRTTVSNLKKAIDGGGESYHEDVFLGKVAYSDYIPHDELSRFSIITTKNNFYEYEKELRLIIFHHPQSEGGVIQPYKIDIGRQYLVNVDQLIDQIYLSPFAGPWFEKAFRQVLAKVRPELVDKIALSEIMDQ